MEASRVWSLIHSPRASLPLPVRLTRWGPCSDQARGGPCSVLIVWFERCQSSKAVTAWEIKAAAGGASGWLSVQQMIHIGCEVNDPQDPAPAGSLVCTKHMFKEWRIRGQESSERSSAQWSPKASLQMVPCLCITTVGTQVKTQSFNKSFGRAVRRVIPRIEVYSLTRILINQASKSELIKESHKESVYLIQIILIQIMLIAFGNWALTIPGEFICMNKNTQQWHRDFPFQLAGISSIA